MLVMFAICMYLSTTIMYLYCSVVKEIQILLTELHTKGLSVEWDIST